VPWCAPAGAVWLRSAALFPVKKRHSGKERKVISAGFADARVPGDFLKNAGKRCGNVLFSEIMDKAVT